MQNSFKLKADHEPKENIITHLLISLNLNFQTDCKIHQTNNIKKRTLYFVPTACHPRLTKCLRIGVIRIATEGHCGKLAGSGRIRKMVATRGDLSLSPNCLNGNNCPIFFSEFILPSTLRFSLTDGNSNNNIYMI